jgi:alpha-L-fucosidase 2
LISSSRPGTQPANLQGIWNDDQNPAWDSKYTTNINTEMNYWAVDSANLSELGTPLYKMIGELTDQVRRSPASITEHAAGSFTRTPISGASRHRWTDRAGEHSRSAVPWLSTHLWEHYEYSQDKVFLAKYYPVIEGSAQFFIDFLVKHPNGKWLVTSPSTSPENFPDGGG